MPIGLELYEFGILFLRFHVAIIMFFFKMNFAPWRVYEYVGFHDINNRDSAEYDDIVKYWIVFIHIYHADMVT